VLHEPHLIATLAVGLSLAFVGGLVARRLRLPTIVGYLLAGVLIGPFTPGFVADQEVATELAEIGVILLMFGVGIHFSIADLLAVRRIAVPGAIGQIAVATALGVLLGFGLGWGLAGGLVLGLAVSVASTVVLLRALIERGALDSPPGRVAIGWLIVEDLFTVLVLVLLPTLAPLIGGNVTEDPGSMGPLVDLGAAIVKLALFGLLMIVVGMRFVPWLLGVVARERSRELFTLAVLAAAIGIAYLSFAVFGVSVALGAFLAGVVVSESDMSHQAAADALPLRDAFAVLFFVSVGMLVDPAYLIANPLPILAVVAIVVVAKSIAALAIVAVAGYAVPVGLTVAAGLAQIGEFSFIVATLGLSLGLLPPEGLQLVVAGALVSITLNPFVFRLIDPLADRVARSPRWRRLLDRRRQDVPSAGTAAGAEPLRGHAIICGYGRVGRLIAAGLGRRGFKFVVITDDRREVDRLRTEGVTALYGDAANAELLVHAGLPAARVLVVAMSDAHAARIITERARRINPNVALVVRTHSADESQRLRRAGPLVQAVHSELELAVQMTRYALRRFGVSMTEAELIAQGLRERGGQPERQADRDGGRRSGDT
jgi:CPA2 family monovalent cation:H+ antiporter-2